jgi:hypothetical protein
MTHVVVVDLQGVVDARGLLERLGDVLELGGPNGNHRVESGTQSGWGMNWDALADSLLSLDTGGIWGTSSRASFPLLVRFDNVADLRAKDPSALHTLAEVLQRVRARYAQDSLSFEYSMDQQ